MRALLQKIIALHYLQSGNFGNIILSQDWRACPHQGWGLIKPLALGRGVKEKHARQSVHLSSKAYGANLIKSVGGGGFEGAFTSLMWKIRPGCKKPNQTTAGSLGVIRAKEEPAAASSTASQSPPRTGSLLAGQGRGRGGKRQVLIPSSASVASELWRTTERRNSRQAWDVRIRGGKKVNLEV